MNRNYTHLSHYKDTSALGDNICLIESEKGYSFLMEEDIQNGVNNPLPVGLYHKNYEEHFKARFVSQPHLFGLDAQKDLPKETTEGMLNNDDYQVYQYVNDEYQSVVHLLRGDGIRIAGPQVIDSHILNDRKYRLDDFLEQLVQRKNLWLAYNSRHFHSQFLQTPVSVDDEDKLAGIIQDFNLNENCEGLEADMCEAFFCVVDLNQHEIEQVRDYARRYAQRQFTEDEIFYGIYNKEEFIAYEILGGKQFVIEHKQKQPRRFKR